MKLNICPDQASAGREAARMGAALLRAALGRQESASIILATGASQFATLEALREESAIAWERVTVFHLDEYVGLPITHPASFRQYLWTRFHRQLPVPPRAFHYIDGMSDPGVECQRLAALIAKHPVDVCFAGIGENAHLAFNDPPADFETDGAFAVVQLDEACRRQQLGEGWFPSLEAVPTRAISMTIRQILRSRSIVLTVPDERKATAVRNSVEGPITPLVPASILQTHPAAHLFLDPPAASLLREAAAAK
jgi:glucosamine-6-phosphate deaminase